MNNDVTIIINDFLEKSNGMSKQANWFFKNINYEYSSIKNNDDLIRFINKCINSSSYLIESYIDEKEIPVVNDFISKLKNVIV